MNRYYSLIIAIRLFQYLSDDTALDHSHKAVPVSVSVVTLIRTDTNEDE